MFSFCPTERYLNSILPSQSVVGGERSVVTVLRFTIIGVNCGIFYRHQNTDTKSQPGENNIRGQRLWAESRDGVVWPAGQYFTSLSSVQGWCDLTWYIIVLHRLISGDNGTGWSNTWWWWPGIIFRSMMTMLIEIINVDDNNGNDDVLAMMFNMIFV